MSTNEFDRLIAKNGSRVSYEYDAGDWEQLSRQLAAARQQKQVRMLAYRTSGIAASVAILLLGLIFMLSEKGSPDVRYASRQPLPTAAPLASADSSSLTSLPGIPHKRHYKVPAITMHQEQAQPAADTASDPAMANNDKPANTAAAFIKDQPDTFTADLRKDRQGYQEPASLPYVSTESKAARKRLGFSLTGGVNYGTIHTGYAIGAAAEQKLGSRFGIEVTVAYVGNIASMSGSRYAPAPSGGTGGYLPVTGPSAGPAAIAAPLNYLQCSPMAGYSLSQKFTLSAGADLQRLLQEQSVAVWYKDNARIAPLVDLGLLLKAEYNIAAPLRAGVSYRIGANNMIAPGNNYFDRSYLQLQLKYRLR